MKNISYKTLYCKIEVVLDSDYPKETKIVDLVSSKSEISSLRETVARISKNHEWDKLNGKEMSKETVKILDKSKVRLEQLERQIQVGSPQILLQVDHFNSQGDRNLIRTYQFQHQPAERILSYYFSSEFDIQKFLEQMRAPQKVATINIPDNIIEEILKHRLSQSTAKATELFGDFTIILNRLYGLKDIVPVFCVIEVDRWIIK